MPIKERTPLYAEAKDQGNPDPSLWGYLIVYEDNSVEFSTEVRPTREEIIKSPNFHPNG
jgi:hypothetical protein